MAYKVILISYPIRGRLFSTERYRDISALRQLLDAFRRGNISCRRSGKDELVVIAPYLLYASTLVRECELTALRKRFVGWDNVPPQEVWMCGGDWCEGMEAEALHARRLGLPVYMFEQGSVPWDPWDLQVLDAAE